MRQFIEDIEGTISKLTPLPIVQDLSLRKCGEGMTKEEAWKIIRSCDNWNTGQRSLSLVCNGIRTKEDDVLDARRDALAQAWRVVGEDKK